MSSPRSRKHSMISEIAKQQNAKAFEGLHTNQDQDLENSKKNAKAFEGLQTGFVGPTSGRSHLEP